MTAPPIAPEHITPKSLLDMSGDQIDTLIEFLQERRLTAVRHYEQAVAAAKEASDEIARDKLEKQCDMCAGNIARVDKALEALESRVNKIRALRLELGLD